MAVKADKREEILGLLMMVVAVMVLFSVLPAKFVNLLSSSAEGDYGNLIGMAGDIVNQGLKFALGLAAYVVPVYLLVWGWRIFRGKGSPLYPRLSWLLAVLGLSATLLVALYEVETDSRGFDFGGGAAGRWVANYLIVGVGDIGSYILVSLVLLLSTMAITGLSLRRAADGIVWLVKMTGLGIAYLTRAAGNTLLDSTKKKTGGKKAPADKKPDKVKKEKPEKVKKEFEPLSVENEEEPDNFEFNISLDDEDIDFGEDEPPPVREKAPEPRVQASLKLDSGGSAAAGDEYELPPLDILTPSEGPVDMVSDSELKQMGEVLMKKLADFSVEGELVNITRGPQVSTFEIRPAPGIKVGKIAALDDDLAMAMHAKKIRIVAPIPGKGAVGVELPNPTPEMVRARDLFSSPEYHNPKYKLPLGLGKDLEGRIRFADMTRMPHLLIAGSTGSGKSVCMNILVSSILFKFKPDQVRMLMIDPKMIELNLYNDIPHLLHPVVTEAREAARVFKWAVLEMETRYRLLSRNGVRNIEDFNARVDSDKPVLLLDSDDPDRVPEKLPYILMVVDELSDLMCSEVKNDIEGTLVRLAQMARAVGIHLVVATQRPSVDVITGLIKANFPSRMSFQVMSKTDSRTILDASGADQLLRNGDMLFLPAGQAEPNRIQGAYISSEETENLVTHWRKETRRLEELHRKESVEQESGRKFGSEPTILDEMERRERGSGLDGEEELDELFAEAARLVVRHDQGSTSLIQRRLKVGYARAGRIVDQLESAGILGPPDGSKAREVLIGPEDLESFGIESE